MKQIKNYENYLITDNGEVINQNSGKKLKGSISENGYQYYRLSNKDGKKMFYAHRLVAEHYINNPDVLPVVNHKDGNKLNNNVNNLEWVSYSDNIKHAYQIGLISDISPIEYYKEDFPDEQWKQYLDYENYLISSYGRIINKKTKRVLKPSIIGGYYKIRLSKNGKVQDYLIHKLVFALFNQEEYLKDKKYVIDHIDGNKLNNNILNLRKLTISENVIAALYEQKTNNSAIPIQQFSLDGVLINTYPSAREAARQLNLDASTITKVCKGKNKTHGGFIFKYLE